MNKRVLRFRFLCLLVCAILVSAALIGFGTQAHYESAAPLHPPRIESAREPGTSCSATPPNMVAWWKAEGNASDSVGLNHGGLLNGSGFGSGLVGEAFFFNGNIQYVTVPHSDSISPSVAVTVEAWVKVAVMPSTQWSVVNKDNPASGPYNLFIQSNGQVGFGIFTTQSGGWQFVYSPENQFAPGSFFQVAGTYDADSGQYCVYVDGVPTCRTSHGLFPLHSDNTLKIGGDVWNSVYLNGAIDEVKIYNRALSAAEIRQIYQCSGSPVWPVSGHDARRTGRSSFSVLDSSAAEPGWTKQTGEPITGDIAVSAEGNIYFYSDKLYALKSDGSNYAVPVNLPGLPSGSPAIDDQNDFVYFGFLLSESTFSEYIIMRYSKELDNGTEVARGSAAYRGLSPVMVGSDGTIYFSAGGFPSSINAVGTTSWSRNICPAESGNAPAIGADGSLYLVCPGDAIYKLDKQTGNSIARKPYELYPVDPMIDDLAQVISGYQRFDGTATYGAFTKWDSSLNLVSDSSGFSFYNLTQSRPTLMPDGVSTLQYASNEPGRNVLSLRGTTSWIKYSDDKVNYSTMFSTSPSVDAGGKIFVGKASSLMRINPADGSTVWESPTNGRVTTQPTISVEGIYVGTDTGAVHKFLSDGNNCGSGLHGSAYNDTALVPAYPGDLGKKQTPVILIHGIHGNRHDGIDSIDQLYPRYFHNLIESLNGSAAYNNSFKTYKFHYVSDRHTTQEIAKALRDRIDEICEFGNKEVIIVAHSMGGIVARHYMLQTTNRGTYAAQPAGERVQKLITLATLHHGTYGANGLARVFDEFHWSEWATATTIFAAADASYWSVMNGCSNCANPFNTQLPNRGSLLWNNNFDSRFTPERLNQLPWEIPLDLPSATIYNNKIIAYWGEISPRWRLLNIQPHDLPGLIAHGGEGWDDEGLAAAGYLIQAADEGSLSVVPAPENDGFVPVESARFDGAALMGSVHCPGYNHRNMRDGDGEDVKDDNRVGHCYDGNNDEGTLFESVQYRITEISGTTPRILVGPDRAGFGSQTYGLVRLASSEPTNVIEIHLSNLGDESLQITSLSLAGENPDQFAIVNAPSVPFSVAATSGVSMTVAFNPTSPGPKKAILRAENDSANSPVTVNISATGLPAECDLNFSPASQFIPTAGGTGEVMVGNIGCPWTVSALDNWIHPQSSGNRVTFSVDANTTGNTRYGTIVVSVYGRSYLYSISQDAANAPCWLSLSSDQSVMQTEAGSGTFDVTTPNSCNWNIQSDSPWLTHSQTTLQGSGQIGFTVTPNFGSARSGIITIQTGETSAQYVVHQVKGTSVRFAYDGDRKADLSVWRASDNFWYIQPSTGGFTGFQWGVAGDLIAPADYDGDGKTDIAVFRPSEGVWYIVMSQSQTFQAFSWGVNGDLPVPADHDGDGKSDLVVYRDSDHTFYKTSTTGSFFEGVAFGIAGDKPMIGDFDNDGKADVAVYRPSDTNWYVLRSSGGFTAQQFGEAGDVPVPADYDGDGATDPAVYRPSTGFWYMLKSGGTGYGEASWGIAGDVPVPADYDGDGKADPAVFRPSEGVWYLHQTTAGLIGIPFGQAGDVPTPSAFIY